LTFWRPNQRIPPALLGAVLVLAAVSLFGRLGWWQLERAEQKRALAEQFEAGQRSTVEATAQSIGELPRYQRVRVQGHYDSAHQVLLDNMPSPQGRPGYRVLTPFELASGGWLLVDRGWTPLRASRATLPDIAVGEQERSIAGRLDRMPAPGLRLGEPPAAKGEWPRVLHYPRLDELQEALERPLAPQIMVLDGAEPDGFERSANVRLGMEPRGHLGYAFQWFAFAALAVILYLVLVLRRKAPDR
jgi:surfeit locus 1 family protein